LATRPEITDKETLITEKTTAWITSIVDLVIASPPIFIEDFKSIQNAKQTQITNNTKRPRVSDIENALPLNS
jgi:hypothetical protein